MRRRPKWMRVTGIVLRCAVFGIVFGVIAVLLWRIFFSVRLPDTVKSVSVNPALVQAYEECGGDFTSFTQAQVTVTNGENNGGYFAVPLAVFYPDANQMQAVLRYNHSTLSHVAEDYCLEKTPDSDGVWFDVTAVVKYRDGTTRRVKAETAYARSETSLYSYFRYTFNDIPTDETVESVFLDIFYLYDIRYGEDAYGRLALYDADGAPRKYTGLSASDRKLLETK